MKTCFEDKRRDIMLKQAENRLFIVRYGKQVKAQLTYEEAATELGACIMHALACEEKLTADLS